MLTNHVAVIDSGYRGEVVMKFKIVDKELKIYNIGDRIAQMIILPYPQVHFVETDTLSETDRGTGGYGSTGV
jgi:dUTP pyrophosphatase